MRKHLALDLSDCRCLAHQPRSHGVRKSTTIEKILVSFLSDAGFTVRAQEPFGLFKVDAYLPEYRLAFEADGSYWHAKPEVMERDKRKDAFLLERGVPVIRFTEPELYELEEAFSRMKLA